MRTLLPTPFGLFLVFFSLSTIVVAQQEDTLQLLVLKPVFVVEAKPSFATSSRNITAITNSEMRETGAQTLSDALATLPGVGQLTTGPVSRPVIRGLFGNRLQINLGGQRLEDQQWEDENGLGLSDIGVQRVELIKGPSSLLFGSEALGGVVNLIEEDYAGLGKTRQELNLKAFSNTYGAGLDYGIKTSGKYQFLLRAGLENHADYSDGDGNRVPNTRFAMYNLKTGYLLHRNNWTSDTRLHVSLNQFGFLKDTVEVQEAASEPRLSREFEDENQRVLFTILSSKNTIELDEDCRLNLLVGLQANHRQEVEGEEESSLNLWLKTFTLNASILKQFDNNWAWTIGTAAMAQTNRNIGDRILVPDANTLEAGVFNYFKKQIATERLQGNFEVGIRYDRRQIKTLETETLNPAQGVVSPFSKPFDELNGSIGQSIILGNLVLKADVGTGFRTGNLAELSANGQHEGTPRWYVGNPNLKVEQCINLDLSAQWRLGGFALQGSVFRNHFRNYIYLNPTNDRIMDFPVFRYEQTDAMLQGFEASASYERVGKFQIDADYAFLDARRNDGTWLPFIPANRFMAKGKYFLPIKNTVWTLPFVSLGTSFTQAQDHPSVNETRTPSYWLVQAGAGVTIRSFRILLTCRNLTNRVYNDHLSLLKYINMHDQGRNFVLNLGWQF
ncbi:MAG: TonB-dependent receptor [Bacteroidetes bacterium]|nr:TonB-dependent receptor [Bacteroidota bacterium]